MAQIYSRLNTECHFKDDKFLYSHPLWCINLTFALCYAITFKWLTGAFNPIYLGNGGTLMSHLCRRI